MRGYDEAYRSTDHLFGEGAEPLLQRHLHLIDHTMPVLDIGAGQGRHVFPLASSGIPVVALEPSMEGAAQLEAVVRDKGWPVEVVTQGFEGYEPGDGRFGAILLFGLIQMLPRESIQVLLERCTRWLAPGGLLFVVAWTTDDPRFQNPPEQWQTVGRGSFSSLDGNVYTYLDPGELKGLFPSWEVVEYTEAMGAWHTHGKGEPEQHFRVEALFRKPS